MQRIAQYIKYTGLLVIWAIVATSCEKFLNPVQELNITEDKLYGDWYEYRSVEMGLYGLQQKLVEQLFILGELRGDLVNITPSATADMVEVCYFNVSKTNEYASPTNLFKLISACNNFIYILEKEHPEVLDPDSPVDNYDRLYGEALCMKAWAYFTAVRIYGKVPFIPQSLVTYQEIEQFVNSSGTYIDSVYISYNKDGYHNDTIQDVPIELEKQYFDLDQVVDYFTELLENNVKAVGVNHYIENNDISWEVTIWNEWAMHALLGQMYLTRGDLVQAADHFGQIMYNPSENLRYQLTRDFEGMNWRTIFTTIDSREHIYTLWFNKSYFQQNPFQSFFESIPPHKHMMKPTYKAIFNWETVWREQRKYVDEADPGKSLMIRPGIPTDSIRGNGASYLYLKNDMPITEEDFDDMYRFRAAGDFRSSRAIMEGMDTIINKYSIGRTQFDQDANYIIYRAAGIHLYMAEVYVHWLAVRNDILRTEIEEAVKIVNDGTNYTQDYFREQRGVRGRVGLGERDDRIYVENIIYTHDPFTNEILGYRNLFGKYEEKQRYLEDQIMNEKARELAFEGERFYDLMRVAKRRNDPSYLAKAVSEKFPAGERDQMYNLLLDESNWYINYFEE